MNRKSRLCDRTVTARYTVRHVRMSTIRLRRQRRRRIAYVTRSLYVSRGDIKRWARQSTRIVSVATARVVAIKIKITNFRARSARRVSTVTNRKMRLLWKDWLAVRVAWVRTRQCLVSCHVTLVGLVSSGTHRCLPRRPSLRHAMLAVQEDTKINRHNRNVCHVRWAGTATWNRLG